MTPRLARSARLGAPLFFSGAVLLVALTLASPVRAQWAIPKTCTAGVTSDDFGEPPIVEYYAGDVLVDHGVQDVTFDKNGQGYAQVFIKANFKNSHLLVVTYTPFLIGSFAIQPTQFGNYLANVTLPAAGYSPNPQSKVFDAFTVTITDSSNKPMPGASVMWEPFFAGADPFVTITDSNGQMVINCFQTLPAGNPVYVVSADGKTQFQTNIVVTNAKATLKAGARAKSASTQHHGFGANQ